jgi:ubiquinone/menaquinone biosynthesis C-methylase UbiE
MLAERFPELQLTGVDLAPTMIELALGHAAKSPAGSRVKFQVANALELPFPDASFDAVHTSGSIRQWPDAGQGLREIHRVLKPGGRLFSGDLNRASPPEGLASIKKQIRHWMYRTLITRNVSQGMSHDEIRELCLASPFGSPSEERLIFDGAYWILVAKKAAS